MQKIICARKFTVKNIIQNVVFSINVKRLARCTCLYILLLAITVGSRVDLVIHCQNYILKCKGLI